MKKTIGTIITALLITLISTVCAFAATPETIDWFYSEDSYYSETYVYGGQTLETGRTDIANNTDDYRVYYGFNVEKTGYYYIDTENDSYVYIPESTDSENAYGVQESVDIGNNEERLFYLDAGKTIIGINFYGHNADDIAIMYCGEEIVDFTIEESSLNGYIIDYDLFSDCCELCEEYFYAESDSVITFSSGIVLEAEEIYFSGRRNSPLSEGKNSATVEFLGKEKVVEYTAYSIESVVESAELSNVENYQTTKTDYLGDIYFIDVPNETLTVNFTDGTSTTVEIVDNCGMITLPTGREVEAYVGIDIDGKGNSVFDIEIAYQSIESFAIEMESFTFAENLVKLNDNNKNYLEWAKNDFIYAFENLHDNFELSIKLFGWSAEYIACIFENLFTFIKFYMTVL